MKKIVVLGIAAFSMGWLHAQDAAGMAAPNAAPKPPTPEPSAGPGAHPGPHGPGGGLRRRHMEMIHDRKGSSGPGRRDGQKFGHGQMLAQQLNLAPEQREKVKTIVQALKPRIAAIQEEERGKIKAVTNEAINDIRPILTPEQAAVLDDMQKLREDRAALDAVRKPEAPNKPRKNEEEKGK